ncbi:hypothetical protein AFA91_13910 [Mycolicibacterium goodii]|uniref:Uncharacterized protein n=1 Tax=Mycolicibacterium goodii TaxID=134601 RepID=A0A0K0X5X2_MYCGD|nr:hypothetical protein AFA91_13910 [Mycolicibacterium goodii]
MIRFTKPSAWRYFWSTVGAAFLTYFVVVLVVYILAIATVDRQMMSDEMKQPTNSYVGLLMWDIVFAGPIFMLMFWFITLPVIVALGAILACIRVDNATEATATTGDPSSTIGDD